MNPIDWHAIWVPRLNPLEVIFRISLVYLFVQFIVRVIGRKQLGRYAPFDIVLFFLLTVCMRTSVVGQDSSLTSTFLAFGTLAAWDRLFSWLSFRSRRMAHLLEGSPLELVRQGELVLENLRRTQVSKDDLLSQLRAHGKQDLRAVQLALLEANGKVTFIFSKEEAAAVG